MTNHSKTNPSTSSVKTIQRNTDHYGVHVGIKGQICSRLLLLKLNEVTSVLFMEPTAFLCLL